MINIQGGIVTKQIIMDMCSTQIVSHLEQVARINSHHKDAMEVNKIP